MPGIAHTPKYLRLANFQNPPEANNGPFQSAYQTKESLWEWLARHPDHSRDFNSFMESSRGNRPNWVDWYPVQERIIDGSREAEGDVLIVDMAAVAVVVVDIAGSLLSSSCCC